MNRKTVDILACPIDKNYPLELFEIISDNEIIKDGSLFCTKCNRFFPIINEIPIMLPDDMRDKNDDLNFLKKWEKQLPKKILYHSYPCHL